MGFAHSESGHAEDPKQTKAPRLAGLMLFIDAPENQVSANSNAEALPVSRASTTSCRSLMWIQA